MTVTTRFAPSPTGFLHIGGARTALFNYLYAKHHQGKFLLRIEDTDQLRSTTEATKAILNGLQWLGLYWDEQPVFQSHQQKSHLQAAHMLLEKGHAYYCTCTPAEIEAMRAHARAHKKIPRYDGRCRHKKNTHGALRILMPENYTYTLEDAIQGTVRLNSNQLDDFIIVRSDGSPTYMLSVVVDDYHMNISHIIRGDDHLTNAFRQIHLYQALEWTPPHFAHIPLIHGPDGAKLSKRHGALGVEFYKEEGYLPKALQNYLARLGWSHGDAEIFSLEKATEWFSLEKIGKSAARLDFKKLEHTNALYIRKEPNPALYEALINFVPIENKQEFTNNIVKERIIKGLTSLKERAKTLKELAQKCLIYCENFEIALEPAAQKFCTPQIHQIIQEFLSKLEDQTNWQEKALEELAREHCEKNAFSLGKLAQPLRVALTGSTVSPSIFEVLDILGKPLAIKRLKKFLTMPSL